MYVCMFAIHGHNPAPTNLNFDTPTHKDTGLVLAGFVPSPHPPPLNVPQKPKGHHFKRRGRGLGHRGYIMIHGAQSNALPGGRVVMCAGSATKSEVSGWIG